MAADFFDVNAVVALQEERTKRWHSEEPGAIESDFLAHVEANHRENFLLWHREDEARRDDMGAEYVYQAKRAIDGHNQRRNNCMEQMDKFVMAQAGEFAAGLPMHTETPGMIIDRLSILALKRYHMAEETEREDVDAEHIQKCKHKLGVIEQQLADLKSGLANLISEVSGRTRGFRVYYQFKMYNDPSLNPQLYQKKG